LIPNILVSALLTDTSLSAYLIALWQDGSFTLLICADQLDELTRVTRYPKIKDRITPAAGRLINHEGTRIITVRGFLTLAGKLP
jgi:predicted nucleic acid-binding protein